MTGSKTPKKHGGKPFAPGDERINRGGRPPVALCLTDTLRADALALAEMRIGRKTIRGENVRLVSARLWALARSGNTAAIKILYDRCDGLAKATLEVNEPTNLTISVIYVKRPSARAEGE